MAETQELSHKDARFLMTLAWDNEISADDNGRLLDHVEQCPKCRKALARMCKFYSLLDEGFAPAYAGSPPRAPVARALGGLRPPHSRSANPRVH